MAAQFEPEMTLGVHVLVSTTWDAAPGVDGSAWVPGVRPVAAAVTVGVPDTRVDEVAVDRRVVGRQGDAGHVEPPEATA